MSLQIARRVFDIEVPDAVLAQRVQFKFDNKTKPVKSLGEVEALAVQIATIQNTLTPVLRNPRLYVFAADHGVCDEGVSAFPQEVTQQMVANFLAGGAAANVLARQHSINMYVVDAGVKAELEPATGLIDQKLSPGTQNFARGLAMPLAHVIAAIDAGAHVVDGAREALCNVVLLGEMGIGNTTSAAALTHLITGVELSRCVGAGTGLDHKGLIRKAAVIERALAVNRELLNIADLDPYTMLSVFGGYEIAMMVGAYLQAAQHRMVIVVDGFIATAALAVACLLNSRVLHYCIFSHGSAEQGHGLLLNHLGRTPLLNLAMRLGEGSGSAIAYPLLVSALSLLNEMASFGEAGVSERSIR
ncbi:MAG TPA: nicotinate-nucleotide--dimethylbenzimidazole phosphoribosyltransferase [Marinagarivorans sp.]